MNPEAKKENVKSTPVENKQPTVRNHANQSTDSSVGGKNGILAIVVLIAIILLGIWFFTNI